MDISFCVPIYNVELYLGNCINSILKVEKVDFEIICVDDCSTDNSVKVIKEYVEKYDNIFLYQNDKNHGVSYSRNFALSKAKGKYIWFVDGDDLINFNCVKRFFDVAEKEEVNAVWGNFVKISENEYQIEREFNNEYVIIPNKRTDYFFPQSENGGNRLQTIWSGIYNREFLINNGIKFDEEIFFCEDLVFHFYFCKYFDKIARFNTVSYFYRQRNNSATKKYSIERQKKNYYGSKRMLFLYESFLKNGMYNSDESEKMANCSVLPLKIEHIKQNNLQWLATIKDRKFIKKELKNLREEGSYPYKFRKEAIKEGSNLVVGVLLYLMPIEFFFWILHFLYSITK